MPYLFRTPKFQTAFLLILIFLTALIQQPSLFLFFRFLAGVGMATAIDILLQKIRKIKPFFPTTGIVTGCIIVLLLAPNLSIIELFLAVLLALVSKHFLRIDKKHIFNPAAFGLFFASVIFAHNVSWWATSFQQLPLRQSSGQAINNYQLFFSFLILLVPGYISVVRVKRARIIFTFLVTYVLLNFILSRSFTLVDPTVLFFSLVMLPEPMTTPNRPSLQILFGVFVALLSIFLSYPFSIFNFQFSIFISDPLILALLVGNIVFLIRDKFSCVVRKL